MIDINQISKENWDDILKENSPDDSETIQFLKDHEEEILDILIGSGKDMPLSEKRKKYIRDLLADNSYREDVEEVISKIDDIRETEGYSILQLGKRLPGSSYIVFEFGDKVLKFGKYYRVLKDPIILQPELQMSFGTNNDYMTVYERLPEVFPRNDFDMAQEMYNRVRSRGILWFDAIGNNVGRTSKRIDENDDGLRIIDGQYMEYETEVLRRIDPERNPMYKDMGPGMYSRAIRDYIFDKGYRAQEEEFQKSQEEKRTAATKQDVKKVANESSIKGLQRVKQFFVSIFKGKEKPDKDER